MVRKLVLFDKVYNINSEERKKKILKKYLNYLKVKIQGFPKTKVTIKKLRNYDNRVELEIEGPEEVFIYNLLKKEQGTINKFKDVLIGDILKGFMVEVGKVGFGIFIDCGIFEPQIDVLLSLNSIRNQLCGGKKVSLIKVIKSYELMDNFPVYIKIINKDKQNEHLEGILAEKTIIFFKKILDEHLEAIFLSGETKGPIKKALIKTGHLRDIITIVKFGFLEHIVLFKQNTEAPGIIADIGPFLKNCKISAIRSERIRKLYEEENI